MNNIIIPKKARVRVYWNDQPHNYSKENKIRVRNHFAKKYGIDKDNIQVVYRAVKKNDKGELIEVAGAGVDNIMDINYQRTLMKELIERDSKDVDFSLILKLDDKVNAELDYEFLHSQHKKYSIKWIEINNFLCFGENNRVSLDKCNNLTLINSFPQNFGGKTTFSIDSFMFLLYGKTTKTDKNEEIFNRYSENNKLSVKGSIEIEGEELIIERMMSRSAKKSGGWNVTNKVNYYKILPDGEEECLNEEEAKQTTKKIKETIGSDKDFEMLVLATENNLDDLIGLTSTESGKLLTRLIGLEVVEKKEAIVREMYNDFQRKKLSNTYDVITLTDEIEESKEKIVTNEGLIVTLNNNLTKTNDDINNKQNENDNLLSSKEKIDNDVVVLNPELLNKEIDNITKRGIQIKETIDTKQKEVNELGVIVFDDYKYKELVDGLNKDEVKKLKIISDINQNNLTIKTLEENGVCQTCKRKLDDVDNTKHIEEHKKEIERLKNELDEINKIIETKTDIRNEMSLIKDKQDKKDKIELEIARLEVEISDLRVQIKDKKSDLKKYEQNQKAIQLNNSIDNQISKIKTELNVLFYTRDTTLKNINDLTNEIELSKNKIKENEELVEKIYKELLVEKIYKIYIELVGKKGINKLVLRSVLPIINSEIQRLLDDVCEFEVEIYIDDKNDVQFLMTENGVTKPLKSGSGFEKTAASLALRSVLGKVSTLPMPNFITFDEIVGKVAPENMSRLKLLFDKISSMYDTVFFITHNDNCKDWSDKIITVIKENNISTIKVA